MMRFRPAFRTSRGERATALGLILACLLMIWVATAPNRDAAWAYNPDNLIRLHVVANSDSDADQQVKLAVRDAVSRYLAPALAGVSDHAAAAVVIRTRLAAVTAVADDVLTADGRAYAAQASWGRFTFPTRSYADLVVPAGEYDALRIVLGNGAGRNWWCVLFPPLCFIDLAGGFEPDADVALAGLGDAQVKLIAARDPADVPPVMRSKLLELISRAPSRFRAFARWLAGTGTQPQR